MKFKLIIIAAALLVSASCNGQKKDGAKANLKTQLDSVSYGIGVAIGENLKRDNLDSISVDMLARGIKDIFKNDTTAVVMSQEQANQVISTYIEGMRAKKTEKSMAASKKFFEENKKKEGIQETASGLQYKVIKMGTGSKPAATDTVITHYHGTLIDGKVFDSSVDRGEPVSFPVNQVIPGWTEALQMMPVGSKWTLYIPSNLAYGERGAGGVIGPNETLIFEVELLGIKGKEGQQE